ASLLLGRPGDAPAFGADLAGDDLALVGLDEERAARAGLAVLAGLVLILELLLVVGSLGGRQGRADGERGEGQRCQPLERESARDRKFHSLSTVLRKRPV